jgi:hypothetical protein
MILPLHPKLIILCDLKELLVFYPKIVELLNHLQSQYARYPLDCQTAHTRY